MGRSQALRTKNSRSGSLRIQRQLARIYQKRRAAGRQLGLLLSFLRRHLVLLWLMLWAILAGATIAAVSTLMSPNAAAPLKLPHPSAPVISSVSRPNPILSAPSLSAPSLSAPSLSAPPVLQRQPRAASPISTVGAILLSCAAGCFTLSRCLSPRKTVRVARRLDLAGGSVRRPSQRPVATQQQAAVHQSFDIPKKQLDQPPAATPDLDLGLNPDIEKPLQPAARPLPEESEDLDHPFDWIEPALAADLDLHRQRSISYWL